MQFYNEKEHTKLGNIQQVQFEKGRTREFYVPKILFLWTLKKVKDMPDAR